MARATAAARAAANGLARVLSEDAEARTIAKEGYFPVPTPILGEKLVGMRGQSHPPRRQRSIKPLNLAARSLSCGHLKTPMVPSRLTSGDEARL